MYIICPFYVTIHLYDPTDPGLPTNQIRASFGGNQDAAVAVAVGRCRSGALTAATSSKGGKFPWKFPT